MSRPAPLLLAGMIAGAAPVAADDETKEQPWLRFRAQELHQDRNEGMAVADFNGDGKPDVSAGEFWYEGPDFTRKTPLRKVAPFGGGEYLNNNGEHAIDLNLDGFPDVISGGFMDRELAWYENPGPEALREGKLWKRHVLVDTGLTHNEASILADIDGDGHQECIVNHWQDKHPMSYHKIAPGQGGPKVETVKIAEAAAITNGHGVGTGDLDGDGRTDVIYKNGWYQQLQGGKWKHHADWSKPFMSVPALVIDVDGDGRNDILWGNGHDYGLYWEKQIEPAADGTPRWEQHVIDKSWSQAHVLAWHDLDGDGREELITGKRYYGHGGRDPGANDGVVLYAYQWQPDKRTFKRQPIIVSEPGNRGPGVGLQLRVADLNGDGRPDLAAAGKSGTYIIWNEGRPVP